MLGLLLASTFVLYRNANAFANLLEYPVWLATGLLVPLTLLPGWVEPIAWVLSPYLGHDRDPRGRARRRAPGRRSGCASALGVAYLGARLRRAAQLRAARAQPRDPRADMTAALRVFVVGGGISYRALFNWISPGMYVTTMLGSPLFQILFFVYLGRYAGSQDDDFFVVGNADPDRGDVRDLRHDHGDRERAAVRDAPAAARDAGQPARDLLRPRAPVRRERDPRLRLRLRDRRGSCSASGPRRAASRARARRRRSRPARASRSGC